MNHPVLNSRKNILIYVSIWLLIAGVHAFLVNFNQNIAWSWATTDSLVFNSLYAIFGLSFWHTCKFIPIERKSLGQISVTHLVSSAVASLIWIGLSYTILYSFPPESESYHQFLKFSMPWRILIGSLFYFLIVSLYYLYIYSVNTKQQLIKESELKALVNEAELRSLRFQINPHFIFNSLNSINALTLSEPSKAGEMTIKLSDYLRTTLAKNETQKNSLREELLAAKLYLEIEKIRFGNKIEYYESIHEACLDHPVPNMLLQPLFENAIKHGVYESIEPVPITLNCETNGSFLKISLKNSYDADARPYRGEGIGINNLRSRLERMYNHKNLLNIDKDDGAFKVTVFIPVEGGEN